MKGNFFFTSESVSEGHPDKICDRISDRIVDAAMAQDPYSRIACETLCTTGLIIISGEITTKAVINYAETARQACREIGYTDSYIGFSADGYSSNDYEIHHLELQASRTSRDRARQYSSLHRTEQLRKDFCASGVYLMGCRMAAMGGKTR